MSDSPRSALPQDPGASDTELQVLLHGDSLMFLGPESALARLDESSPQEKLSRVAPKVAHNLSKSAHTLSQFQENSGRYLKLSKDSAQFLKENEVAAEKIRAGVLRVGDLPGAKGNAGSIVKHLKFENTALLATPAAPLAVAAILEESAAQAQMDQVLDYLEEVSENVQKLIQQRKTEVSGDINGFADAIEEAFILLQKTGKVSAVSWSKVDNLDVDLKRLQGQIIGELDEVAKEIAKKATNPKKAYQAFTEAEENATYWIFQLARVMVLQNQLNILELNRVATSEPDHLEQHRQGIAEAKAKREERIINALNAIADKANDSATFKDLQLVLSRGGNTKAAEAGNRLLHQLNEFATTAGIDAYTRESIESTSWRDAIKHTAERASDGVADTYNEARGKIPWRIRIERTTPEVELKPLFED